MIDQPNPQPPTPPAAATCRASTLRAAGRRPKPVATEAVVSAHTAELLALLEPAKRLRLEERERLAALRLHQHEKRLT